MTLSTFWFSSSLYLNVFFLKTSLLIDQFQCLLFFLIFYFLILSKVRIGFWWCSNFFSFPLLASFLCLFDFVFFHLRINWTTLLFFLWFQRLSLWQYIEWNNMKVIRLIDQSFTFTWVSLPFLDILYELNGELIWEGCLGFGMIRSEKDNGEDEWGGIWVRTKNLCVLGRDAEWGGIWGRSKYLRVLGRDGVYWGNMSVYVLVEMRVDSYWATL